MAGLLLLWEPRGEQDRASFGRSHQIWNLFLFCWTVWKTSKPINQYTIGMVAKILELQSEKSLTWISKILQIANGIEIRTCFQNSSSPKPLLPRRSLIDERVCLASMTQLLTPYNFNFIYSTSSAVQLHFAFLVLSHSQKLQPPQKTELTCPKQLYAQTASKILLRLSESTRVGLSNIWVSRRPIARNWCKNWVKQSFSE